MARPKSRDSRERAFEAGRIILKYKPSLRCLAQVLDCTHWAILYYINEVIAKQDLDMYNEIRIIMDENKFRANSDFMSYEELRRLLENEEKVS